MYHNNVKKIYNNIKVVKCRRKQLNIGLCRYLKNLDGKYFANRYKISNIIFVNIFMLFWRTFTWKKSITWINYVILYYKIF